MSGIIGILSALRRAIAGGSYGTPLHQLLFTGADHDTTTTDSGSAAATVTFVGNAEILSNRLALDGAGDYLTLPTSFNTTTDDWVIRGVANCPVFNNALVTGNSGGGGFYFEIYGGAFVVGDGSTNPINVSATGVSAGVDFAWEVSHLAGTLRLKVDGVLKASVANTLNSLAVTTLNIGARTGLGIYFTGELDSLEVFVNP